MAVGTVPLGSAATLGVAPNTGTEIAPAAGTYAPLSKMNTLTKTGTRNSTSEAVFMESVQMVTFAPKDDTWSVGGFAAMGDSGQDILNAASGTNDIVFIKVLPDGTNGFSQAVRVGTITFGVTPTGRPTITYALAAQAPAVAVGTGSVY